MEALAAASDMHGTFCCGGHFQPTAPLKLTVYEPQAAAAGKQSRALLLPIPAPADSLPELLHCMRQHDGTELNLSADSFCTSLALEQHGILGTIKTLMMPVAGNVVENAMLSGMLHRLYSSAATLSPEQDAILGTIKSLMLPKAACTLTAQLHELTVHRPGNDPAQQPCIHCDSSGNFGILQLCLPQPHAGGQLRLRASRSGSGSGSTQQQPAQQREHVFDWAPGAGAGSGVVQWAAFYGTTAQQVLPVTSGLRIILTYKLTMVPAAEPGPPLPGLSASSMAPLHAALTAALANPAFLPSGGTLGFGCSHAYPHTQEGLCAAVPALLKGGDAALFAIARDLGLKPELQTAIDVAHLSEFPDWVGFPDDDEEPPAAERGDPNLRLSAPKPLGTSNYEEDMAGCLDVSRRTVLQQLFEGSRGAEHVAWCVRPRRWALQLVNPATVEHKITVQEWFSAAAILVKVPPSPGRLRPPGGPVGSCGSSSVQVASA